MKRLICFFLGHEWGFDYIGSIVDVTSWKCGRCGKRPTYEKYRVGVERNDKSKT